jgi:hypothetical protein
MMLRRNGPRPTERLREPCEHREVSVKRDLLQAGLAGLRGRTPRFRLS